MLELLHSRLKDNPGGQYKGVIHCFSGSLNAAREYLEMGFYLSLGGYVSYPSSRGSYDVIRSIPQDRLLVETDCPFLPPQSYRGKRNEPAYLPLTVKAWLKSGENRLRILPGLRRRMPGGCFQRGKVDNIDVQTQGTENYWSLLKRGLYGAFHHLVPDISETI